MASSGTPSLSLKHGVRVQPEPSVPVESVLLAVGDCVGHANLLYASRMNRGVVVFLKEERFVARLIESGVTVDGVYLQVSPLAVPSTRVTVSGVPPFISNEALGNELLRFGKLASGFRTVALGCKSEKLKHVQSFRRQVFMFLNSQSQTLDVSFRVKHGEGHYMVYASTGDMKCFECGDVGHKRMACPHRRAEGPSDTGACSTGAAEEGRDAAATPRDAAPQEGDAVAVESEVGEGCSGQADRQVGERKASKSNDDRLNIVNRTEVGVDSVVEALVPDTEPNGEENSEGGQAAEGDQIQEGGQRGVDGTAGGDEDDEMDYVTDSASVADSQHGGDLYTLEEIDHFLDETFGKSVRVTDFFPDVKKFVKSACTLQRIVGTDLLDERKRFRLQKHVTNVRKAFNLKRVSGRLKSNKET